MMILLFLVGLMLCYVAAVFVVNRCSQPADVTFIEMAAPEESANVQAADAKQALTILTWNIGYAGLGAEADFIYDGGEQSRPASKALVQKNLHGIQQQLSDIDFDVAMLEEVAEASHLTRQVDVWQGVRSALPEYWSMFNADITTRWVPPPLDMSVGNAIFSRIPPTQAALHALPLEPNFKMLAFRKHYRMHVVRLPAPDQQEWVLINIHLAAFDEQARVRAQQVAAVIEFAQAEYSQGQHVVIGGDWNLLLAETNFPHTTAEKHLFWVHAMNPAWMPTDWQWVIDPAVPTVRTNHKPYVVGENYTAIIDGFLVSPNVEAVAVRTHDMQFVYADHQPVVGSFKVKNAALP